METAGERIDALRKRLDAVNEQLAKEVPQLRRGQVWCLKCGHMQKVDSAQCLAHGWPICCGCTMSIASPVERA